MNQTTAHMAQHRPVVAFFDVDETLVAMKSPFSLLRYRLRQQGDADGSTYERMVAPLRGLAAAGGAPVEVASKFYEYFAGVAWGELLAQGREWYAELRGCGVPFIGAALTQLRRHQAAGHAVVAVSGSWSASLGPIAEDLGIDMTLCSEPAVDDHGRLTGGIRRAMFGPAKVEAVNRALARYGANPADCYAYADDPGDLAMLRLVGHPATIGDHPAMTALAAEQGWPVYPATVVAGSCRQPV
jgi:HAD superfamily hydrolase (TIGR01490 family)